MSQRLNHSADASRQRLLELSEALNPSEPEKGLNLSPPPSQRKKQMQLLRDLLTAPPTLDLAREPIACASSPEEIAERQRELDYRLRWLRALTEMTEAELLLLNQARSVDAILAPAADAVPAEFHDLKLTPTRK